MNNPMRPVSLLALLGTFALAACDPAPPAPPAPTPTPTPEPSPTPINTAAEVSVLGYHRFENPARDPLAITTDEFRAQMQAIKDAGIPVIPMADFLAWRRGEKSIPERAIVITIDDGYDDTYTLAWPILQEFGYPFTFYVYTNYIDVGGRAITWDELTTMKLAGVDIASHTVSHPNLAKPSTKNLRGLAYPEWLEEELTGSRKTISEKLGIEVTTLAYPYGVNNETVRAAAEAAGYEASFTVVGQKALHDTEHHSIGRYIVLSDKDFTFTNALKFGGGTAGIQSTAGPAAASMITVPMHGTATSDQQPTLKANLATLGNLDPSSVEMRVSSLGLVDAVYDPATQLITYRMPIRLVPQTYTVEVSGRAGGKKAEAQWSFDYDPEAQIDPEPADLIPPAKEEAPIPEMIPAA
jgi:peptidoglycan/xylan/chitin deacetylase (PgdA/CDA1 family)